VLVDGGGGSDSGAYRLTGNGLSDELNLCVPIIVESTNLNLGGVGGMSNATFILLTTTNITTPGPLWSPILTNQFDQFGVFNITVTNLYNPPEPKRFFRFLVP